MSQQTFVTTALVCHPIYLFSVNVSNSELMVDRRDDGPKEFDICHEREEWVEQRHIPSFMPIKY
jgi:hypothetical protein